MAAPSPGQNQAESPARLSGVRLAASMGGGAPATAVLTRARERMLRRRNVDKACVLRFCWQAEGIGIFRIGTYSRVRRRWLLLKQSPRSRSPHKPPLHPRS